MVLDALDRKVPPVVVTLVTGTAMWFMGGGLASEVTAVRVAGLVATVAAGGAIALSGVVSIRRARTTLDPRARAAPSALVTGGIYRQTRNPMYLGLVLVLLGWACLLANAAAFALVVTFVAYMTRFQILPEERGLRQRFGDEFDEYASRVRRWA